MAEDTPVRDAAIFGHFGGHVNITDGRYVYMRGPVAGDNGPLFEHTLMPTHMRSAFSPAELRDNIERAEPFSFTKGCRTLEIDAHGQGFTGKLQVPDTMLFDLQTDPGQLTPIRDAAVEARLTGQLVALMQACDAPPSQYQRLGLEREA